MNLRLIALAAGILGSIAFIHVLLPYSKFEHLLSARAELDAYLAQAGILGPILVVDPVVLNAISSDEQLLFTDRVIVAVEKKFEHQRLALHKEMQKRPANVTRRIPLSFARQLADLRDFIKTNDNAHLVAHDGTLLGWYRECSIIPHTTDMDFFIRSEEYSPEIVEAFKDPESPYRLYRIYGMINDSYELTVYLKHISPRVKIDIFSMYTTEKLSWTGGLVWKTRQKYKWTYPRLTAFCTGDLLGHLIYIPCNVEDVLKAEYGDWTKENPTSKYVWYKSAKNISPNGKFTQVQMRMMKKNK